jgi:6-phosphogluconate dehydrogenase
MKLAMVGLGRMGANMARRLLRGGHEVAGFTLLIEDALLLASEEGLTASHSLEELVSLLDAPRVIWLMVPTGDPTETILAELTHLLSPGDIVIDGGNSNYKDSLRRATMLHNRGIHFVDVGTSGGIWGLTEGYSLMIGGEPETVERLRPVFETLAPAPDFGWGYVGPHGAGHYAKMVHNGIEYGLMEAYAEGFELLKARSEFGFDLHQVAEIWRHGSVIRSWLLDLIAAALAEDEELSGIRDWIEDSGEGRWTVMDAIDNAVPVPVIALSLFRRFASRQEESYAGKLTAAMRKQFGGHAVVPKRRDVKP